MSKLEHALEILNLGLAVFPLSPNSKIPFEDSAGFKDATHDEEQVRACWAKTPDANIGVHPGDSFVIVDLDMKHGINGLKNFCDEIGVDDWELLSETFTVRTTTGGYHLYYKTDSAVGDRTVKVSESK